VRCKRGGLEGVRCKRGGLEGVGRKGGPRRRRQSRRLSRRSGPRHPGGTLRTLHPNTTTITLKPMEIAGCRVQEYKTVKALAFRSKSFKRFKVFPLCREADRADVDSRAVLPTGWVRGIRAEQLRAQLEERNLRVSG
jgi:hypothetical protein